MKRGDLVKSSKDTSLSASVGIVVDEWDPKDKRGVIGNKSKCVKVLYPSELGKTFAPVDGIFLIREDHLKVVSRAEG